MATTAEIKITADTSQAERALGSLTNTLKSLAGIAIGGSVVKALGDMAISAQEATNKLLSVSDSISEANAKFYSLGATAMRTGSNLGGTVDLFQKLAQSSTFAGSSTQALSTIVENFNKTLQISGASGQSSAAALYQFAQAMQKGTLNGDEFRTMAETNGYFIKILTKELGISATELRQWASDGKLSAEVVAKALMNSKDITEQYGKTVRTIPQAFENLTTSLTMTVKALDDATGASTLLVKGMEALANNMPIVVGAAAGLATALAVPRLIAAGQAIWTMVAGLRAMSVATAIASGGVTLIVGALAGLAAWKMTGAAMDDIKAKQDEINKANDAGLVITHQRNQQALDLDKTLKEHIGSLNAASAIEAKANGYRNIALDVEKAVALEKEKYKKTGEAILPNLERELAIAVEKDILAKEQSSIMQTIASLQIQTTTNSILDSDQRRIQADLDRLKLQYSDQTYNKYKDQVRTLLEQNQLIEAQVKLANARNPNPTIGEYGTIGSSLISSKTESGVAAQAVKEQTVLDQMYANGAVKEKEYQDLKYLLVQQGKERIIGIEQEIADARLKIAGVTNQGIIEAVKNQVQQVEMMRMGGMTSIQGFLGAMDGIFAQMGAHNKQAFETHKKLAIAQALISTYQAAAASLAIPPGPPFSFVYVATAIAAGMAQIAAIQSQQYSGRALGGPVMGNTSYIVGERGPELFTPSTSGSITRNDQLGGTSANINFTIVANDAQGFDDLLIQRKGMIKQFINDAMIENGQRSRM